MAGRLSGRTAVVTGGSAGIGQEIARRLASEGADIAVADLDPAQETRELVMATGRRFLGDEVDVSDEGAVQEFAARVRTELGGAAILVNNAAVVLLADIDLGRDRLVAELIVNITSSSHWTPPPPFVSYVAAKGALNGLTSVLSANLAAHDITVNAVAAGLVPHGKRVQLPADVSGAVAFLASDDAVFITGQLVAADGGGTRR